GSRRADDGPPRHDLTAALLRTQLAATPGVRRLDQPSDPQLLALVLERATRQRYASYLSQALWRRIGAADAWLQLDHPGGTALADCSMLPHPRDWIPAAPLLLQDANYGADGAMGRGWTALRRAPAQPDRR